jgi:hypothetical protein
MNVNVRTAADGMETAKPVRSTTEKTGQLQTAAKPETKAKNDI